MKPAMAFSGGAILKITIRRHGRTAGHSAINSRSSLIDNSTIEQYCSLCLYELHADLEHSSCISICVAAPQAEHTNGLAPSGSDQVFESLHLL